MSASKLLVAVGDIHGRFVRVEGWLGELEQAHGRAIDLVIGMGDAETFATADAPLRKRAKRQEPAEFGPYARGDRKFPAPVVLLGGNNEDFGALHDIPAGGELAPGVRYLGRFGSFEPAGVRAAFLSGIFAPSSFQLPLEPPRTLELARRAGHFRIGEVAAVVALGRAELLLVHDWPRGLARQLPAGGPPAPPAFWGNLQVNGLVDALRPSWVLCGHQHRAWAATLESTGHLTRVACLDEAEKPQGALLWLEVADGVIVRVGWGTGAAPAWKSGEPWDWQRLPA